MKKIILICILSLGYLISQAQYPVNQSMGSDSTLITSKGGLKGRLIVSNFTDTTQANTQRIKDYSGAIIFSNNALWYRDSMAKRWVQLIPTANPSGDTLFWRIGGNDFTSYSFLPALGTTSNDPLYFQTNGLKRLGIAEDGIQPTGVNVVNLGIDTLTGLLSYATGGGGGGSGTVTSISQDYGILTTPNPITIIGSVKLDSATVYGKAREIVRDSLLKVVKYTDTASMLSPYINATDTIGRWVNVRDSLIRYVTPTRLKDTAAALRALITTPNLQRVTDVGDTTTNYITIKTIQPNEAVAQAGFYNPSAYSAEPVSTNQNIYLYNDAQQTRVYQNGLIDHVDFYMGSIPSNLTSFYIDFWRTNQSTGISAIVDSVEVLAQLDSFTTNHIYFTRPVQVQDGDYTGIHYTGSGAHVAFLQEQYKPNWTYYKTSAPSNWSSQNWYAESRFNAGIPVIVFMRSPNVITIGTSLTSSSPNQTKLENITNDAVPQSWPGIIEDTLNLRVQNMGISGSSSTQNAARFTTDVAAKRPRIAVLEGIVNDIRSGVATTTIVNNFVSMLNTCRDSSIVPIVIKIIPCTVCTNAEMYQMDTVAAKLDSLITNIYTNGKIVNPNSVLGQFRSGGAVGNLWDLQPSLTYDGLHLTPAGYLLLAQKVIAQIRILLTDYTTYGSDLIIHDGIQNTLPSSSGQLALVSQIPSVSTTGNFGNIPVIRNGALATPASDSLSYTSATLTVKGNAKLTALTSGASTDSVVTVASDGTLKKRNMASVGSVPTLQQVFDKESNTATLTTDNNIIATGHQLNVYPDYFQVYSQQGNLFQTTNNVACFSCGTLINADLGYIELRASKANRGGFVGQTSNLFVDTTKIQINPFQSNLYVDSLNSSSNTDDSVMVWRASTGKIGIVAKSTLGGGGGSASGNYGNVQLNRFGSFATPASDSLNFSGGLAIKGALSATGLTTSAGVYNVRIDGSGNLSKQDTVVDFTISNASHTLGDSLVMPVTNGVTVKTIVAGSGVAVVATDSTLTLSASSGGGNVFQDANRNVFIGNVDSAYATTATAAGTTTLTNASKYTQNFTGVTTQTIVLPNATTMPEGHGFYFTNNSTGALTVNKNGGTLLQTVAAGQTLSVTVTDISSSAGGWMYESSASRKTTSIQQVGTDANITAAAGTLYALPAATLSTNRTIDVTAINTDLDYFEIDNLEAGFVWSFTGATVYLQDGTTTVTNLAVGFYQFKRINGKIKQIN